MRKPILILSIAAMVGMSATARSLSPTEALGRVTNLPVSRSGSTVSSKPVLTIGEAETPALYVFNKADNGYIIVAADDVAAPLIGYSDNGSFDPSKMPDNMRWWLEQSAQQIAEASAAGAEPYSESRAADREPIAPLMTTEWNQDAPFNNDCPLISGTPTMVGCVATAMAQVMKYHNWPDKVVDNAKFTNTGVTADFSNYEFDWENMANIYYTNNYTEAQASAVSKLMQACGFSINMHYGTTASGAYGAHVGGALVKYFKYDQGVHNEPRELHSSAKWEEMIYNDLRDCGPIVYWGSGTGGSHCFVCDGYRGDGYFHFNWGWGGLSDGYFLLDALSPGKLGIGGGNGGFNYAQGVLLGVKPATATPSAPKYTFYMSKGLNYADAYENALTLYGNFWNYSTTDVNARFVFSVYNEAGTEHIASYPVTSPAAGSFYSNSYETVLSGSIPASLQDGTYRIYPAVEVNGAEYRFKAPGGYTDHALLTRQGGQDTAVLPAPDGEVSIENLKVNGDNTLYIGKRFKVTGTAKFSVDGEVDRYVSASLRRVSDNGIAGDGTKLTIKFSGEGNEFEFVSDWFTKSGTPANIEAGGEYVFAIVENYENIATVPVTVKAAPETEGTYEITKVEIENANAVDPENINVTVTVKGTSGVVDEKMKFAISQVLTPKMDTEAPIFVTEGETATVKVTITPRKYILTKGLSYTLTCGRHVNNKWVISKTSSFKVDDGSGITDIEADSNEPVEYFNLQGLRVDAGNLTPGIYIRRQGEKTSKVVVK